MTDRAAVVYLSNWTWRWDGLEGAPGMGHLWSLAIEGQFYLVWPLALAALVGLRRSPRTVLVLTVAAIGLVVLQRARLLAGDADPFFLYLRTDTRIDALLVGTLLAQLWVRGLTPRRGVATAATASVALLAVAVVGFGPRARLYYQGGFTVLALAAAAIVLAATEGGWWGTRVLETPALRALGRVSYSSCTSGTSPCSSRWCGTAPPGARGCAPWSGWPSRSSWPSPPSAWWPEPGPGSPAGPARRPPRRPPPDPRPPEHRAWYRRPMLVTSHHGSRRRERPRQRFVRLHRRLRRPGAPGARATRWWASTTTPSTARSPSPTTTTPGYRLVEGDARDVDLMTELLGDCDHFIAGAAMIGGISYFHAYAYDLLATNERIMAAVVRRRHQGRRGRAAPEGHLHELVDGLRVHRHLALGRGRRARDRPRRCRPTASRSWPSSTSPGPPGTSTSCRTPSSARSTASASARPGPWATSRWPAAT